MNNKKGFTLVELIISMVIILIVTLGFFSWSTTIIRTNLMTEKNNSAYAMAMDVAERLQRMPDNTLIRHDTDRKCVGFDGSGVLNECQTAGAMNCNGGEPAPNTLDTAFAGRTKYTNPWNSTGNTLYMYDKNNCEGKTWSDTACGTGTNVVITSAANASIDHPNAAGTQYNSINPIRTYRNSTFYAVWSVAYLPCNAGISTEKRKIFVTVYWIDPEPTDTTVADVQTKIGNGTYALKSVSAAVDKTIGTEK